MPTRLYTVNRGIELIKLVAMENKYVVSRGRSTFTIQYDDKYHAVDFQIKKQGDYLQVHQWEEEKGGKYGRAVYSLRTITDVIQFCDILLKSIPMRARR